MKFKVGMISYFFSIISIWTCFQVQAIIVKTAFFQNPQFVPSSGAGRQVLLWFRFFDSNFLITFFDRVPFADGYRSSHSRFFIKIDVLKHLFIRKPLRKRIFEFFSTPQFYSNRPFIHFLEHHE